MSANRTSSIKADEAYTLEEFRRRIGVGEDAVRSLRRKGLKTVKIGKRTFVLGEEFIRFLTVQQRGWEFFYSSPKDFHS